MSVECSINFASKQKRESIHWPNAIFIVNYIWHEKSLCIHIICTHMYNLRDEDKEYFLKKKIQQINGYDHFRVQNSN